MKALAVILFSLSAFRLPFAVLDGLELGLADVVVEPAIPHSAIPIPHLEK